MRCALSSFCSPYGVVVQRHYHILTPNQKPTNSRCIVGRCCYDRMHSPSPGQRVPRCSGCWRRLNLEHLPALRNAGVHSLFSTTASTQRYSIQRGCVRACVCIDVYMCVYVCACMCVHVCACMCAYMCVCLSLSLSLSLSLCVSVCASMCPPTRPTACPVGCRRTLRDSLPAKRATAWKTLTQR